MRDDEMPATIEAEGRYRFYVKCVMVDRISGGLGVFNKNRLRYPMHSTPLAAFVTVARN